MFYEEQRLVWIPFLQRFALPVHLNSNRATTFIEIIDTTIDISCVYCTRHGEYVNPYFLNKCKETVVEIEYGCTSDLHCEQKTSESHGIPRGRNGEDETKVSEMNDMNDQDIIFISNILGLSVDDSAGSGDVLLHGSSPCNVEVVGKKHQESVVPEDTAMEMEMEYRRNQPVFAGNESARLVSGVFWLNSIHWSKCNESLIKAPLRNSIFPVYASTAIPCLLRQLHMIYVSELESSCVFDVPFQSDIPNRVFYPEIPALTSRTLENLYQSVKGETLCALAMVFSDMTFPKMDVEFTDYGDVAALLTFDRLYASDVLDTSGNPLSPWFNNYICRRWGMTEYVRHRRLLCKSRFSARCKNQNECHTQRSEKSWCRFIIRKGVVTAIQHANGDTRGDIEYDTRPLQTLRSKIAKVNHLVVLNTVQCTEEKAQKIMHCVDNMIHEALGDSPPFMCHMNTNSGHLYISHPLFPLGRGVVFTPPEPSFNEVNKLFNCVLPAIESLYKYCVTK